MLLPCADVEKRGAACFVKDLGSRNKVRSVVTSTSRAHLLAKAVACAAC